jgi:glycosyltransferase involved in cell wall biosynthesis
MKIGIVSNLYPPYSRGGAENVVVRTVEELTAKNHEVFVVTGQPRDKGGLKKSNTGAEGVWRFFPKNLYFILDDYRHWWIVRLCWHIIDSFSWYGANQVRQVIEDEEPDIIMTHNLKGIGLRIARAIQGKNVPHVHIVHDLQLIYPSGLLYAGREKMPFYVEPFYAIYRFICRARLGRPDLVIFPSHYLEEVYSKYGFFKHSDISVMPNPAPRFDASPRAVRLSGPLRLLFVGQLEPHKGIKFLLDEFCKLDIDAKLIIAGEGTYVQKLKKRAEQDKRLIYLGFVSLEQLVNCFGIADALIVPSLCYENSPTVIYESLNAGVPVVASDIGGVGELVEDGVNGFLFQPGSESDFVRVLWKLDEKKDEFWSEQEKIKQTVAPYALELYTEKLLKQLQELIDRK